MKNTKIVVILAGIAALLFGFAAKSRGVTGFQEKLGKSIKVEHMLFADDSKCMPPAGRIIG
ncbi:MAG TPA: hypothetical protein DCL44_06700 [Elusimicrobia bacterium]|nr:hypothetical protein [Elusimicrobiota bacterium]